MASNLCRRFTSFCVLAALLIAGAQTAADPGVSNESIVFGQSACFSGPNEKLGHHYHDGLMAAFAERNAADGINGRMLRLISLDDGYEPDQAAANAERFVTENNVLAVIGGVGTPTAARIAPVLRTAGIAFVGHVTGADFLYEVERFPNVVNLRASYEDEVKVLVEHIVNDLGMTRFGIIYQDDAFGRAVLRSFLKALAEHNLPLLVKTAYSRNTHAVHASLFGVAKADLEAILLVGAYAANAEIVNLAESLGHEYTMANLSFALSKELFKLVENPSERILTTEVVPNPECCSELSKRYRDALAAAHPTREAPISEVSLEGYLLGRYLISTLERMGDDLSRAAFMAHVKPEEPIIIDDWIVSFNQGFNRGSRYVRLTNFDGLERVHSASAGGT